MKGWCVCDATGIIKNVMEELKRLSQNSFQEFFQHLYSCWQNFVVAQGEYFGGNVASLIVLFYISQKQSHSENILKLACM
jgi:hypothetical protein